MKRARVAPDGDRASYFMGEALRQARRALARDEVPIGAVVVLGDVIVARGYNRPIAAQDPTAHAELVAIRRAARRLGNYRLTGAELYVTLEPCLMCVGAAVQARLHGIVFAAPDPKVSTLSAPGGIARFLGINHRFAVASGVRAEEAALLLRRFFRARRGSASREHGEVPKWS